MTKPDEWHGKRVLEHGTTLKELIQEQRDLVARFQKGLKNFPPPGTPDHARTLSLYIDKLATLEGLAANFER